MNLSKFLNSDHLCPICKEPLNLYMQWNGQWRDSKCFSAQMLEPNLFKLTPFKGPDDQAGVPFNKMDYFLTLSNRETATVESSSDKLNITKDGLKFYFFYLCNPLGFKDKGVGDYHINLYKGCYYKSTPFMKLSKDNKTIEMFDPLNKSFIKDESFSFKKITDTLERVYALNLNSETKETTLWHYSCTPEQKADEHFTPNLFEKKMPFLNVRPKFGPENREKLISRLDNWILMS